MLGLWLLTRVSDEKRQEMVQSLGSFFAEQAIRPHRRFILQDLSDESLIGWLGYWRTREGLDLFLASPTYRALRGAAETLGNLEEVHRLDMEAVPCSPKQR
jgi:hypothetical protein